MTYEHFIGSLLTFLVLVIGFFLRQLIGEHKSTRAELIKMMKDQAVDHERFETITRTLTDLKTADVELNKMLVNAIERLVRLEERNTVARHSA